jgi:ribosomal protein L33
MKEHHSENHQTAAETNMATVKKIALQCVQCSATFTKARNRQNHELWRHKIVKHLVCGMCHFQTRMYQEMKTHAQVKKDISRIKFVFFFKKTTPLFFPSITYWWRS